MNRNIIQRHLRNVTDCMRRKDWSTALSHARLASLAAEKSGDIPAMHRVAGHLERLGDHPLSAHLKLKSARITNPIPVREWDGSALTGRTIAIVFRSPHIGGAIRSARLIQLAAAMAHRCIVFTEARLVSLLRRSFPGVEVREGGLEDAIACPEADTIAIRESLLCFVAGEEESLAANFVPLRADPALVQEFRDKYRHEAGGGALIGVCWASTNKKKDLPALSDWAAIMAERQATYVSLQYGDVTADAAELRAQSDATVVYDETVDSLVDLDRFAAQVAAMDAVVTISNTGAHMAGALGVPTVIILDDNNHLIWLAWGERTGWYPTVRLVRRNGRNWQDVVADAMSTFEPEFLLGRDAARV